MRVKNVDDSFNSGLVGKRFIVNLGLFRGLGNVYLINYHSLEYVVNCVNKIVIYY